jgi:hypothetical protein
LNLTLQNDPSNHFSHTDATKKYKYFQNINTDFWTIRFPVKSTKRKLFK